MKCPRCQHEVRNEDHFCPHCGYDLKATTRVKPFRFPLMPLLVLLIGVVILPLTSIYLLNGGPDLFKEEEGTGKITISSVSEQDTPVLSYSFYSIEDFEDKVTNASYFVNPLQNYVQQLNAKYNTVFNLETTIYVYSNHNVQIKATMSGDIDKNHTIEVSRQYDRKKTYDDVAAVLTKKNCSTFEELTMNNETEIINHMISSKKRNELVTSFKEKEAIFNKKKDKIGHFGIGVYTKDDSLVLYKDHQLYKSVLTHRAEGDYKLSR